MKAAGQSSLGKCPVLHALPFLLWGRHRHCSWWDRKPVLGRRLRDCDPVFTISFAFQSPRPYAAPGIAPAPAAFAPFRDALRNSETHSLHAPNRAKHPKEPLRLWRYGGNGTLEVDKRKRSSSRDRTLCVPSAGKACRLAPCRWRRRR